MAQIFKSVEAVVKAVDGEEPGAFEAVVAAFGNVDLQGDVIDKGAFADTLKEWAAKGQPIPIIWSHNWDDPFAHIGGADPAKAVEADGGLRIKGVLDVADNPTAAQVHKLMKAGRVTQFSFAADTKEGGWSLTEGEDGRMVQHLSALDLIEVGPTLKGANPETRLLNIKSDRPTLRGQTPPVRKAAGDADEDPNALVQAVDATLDAIQALLAQVDLSQAPPQVQQIISLLTAAESTIDTLLEVLGLPDPDDPDGEAAAAAPAPVAASAGAALAKAGRVLATKHVGTLEEIKAEHAAVGKRLGDLLTAVKTSPSGEDTAKSAAGPTPPTPSDRQARAAAALATLAGATATRKDQQ